MRKAAVVGITVAVVVSLAACRSRADECKDVLALVGGDDAHEVDGETDPAKPRPEAKDLAAAAGRLGAAVRALKVTGDLTTKATAYATAVDDVGAHAGKFATVGSPFGDAGASLAADGLTGRFASTVQAMLLACGPEAKDPTCQPILEANGQFMKPHPGQTVSAVCGQIASGIDALDVQSTDPAVKKAATDLAATFHELEAKTKTTAVTWDDFLATSHALGSEQSATSASQKGAAAAAADLRTTCGAK